MSVGEYDVKARDGDGGLSTTAGVEEFLQCPCFRKQLGEEGLTNLLRHRHHRQPLYLKHADLDARSSIEHKAADFTSL